MSELPAAGKVGETMSGVGHLRIEREYSMSSSTDDYHDESWPQIEPRTERASPSGRRTHDHEDDDHDDADVLPLRAAGDRS